MVHLTKAQRKAVFAIFKRDFPSWLTPFRRYSLSCGEVRVSSWAYRNLRSKIQPYFDKSGCVMLPWRGMWLGIEKDGYTHS
jgi:hypothetical protein